MCGRWIKWSVLYNSTHLNSTLWYTALSFSHAHTQLSLISLYLGIVCRRCIRDDEWEEYFGCFREETEILLDQVIYF